MGTEDYGTQTVIWDYRYPAKGSDFSKSYKNIFKPGIYNGGEMVSDGVSGVNIPALTAIMNVDTEYCIKLDTSEIVNLAIPSDGTLRIVYILFTWSDSINNYADFLLATSLAGVPDNGVILGSATNTGGSIVVDNDTLKTWGYYNFSDACFKGLITDQPITSSVAQGTAPFVIGSTTVSPNLNADLHDGYHAGNSTGQVPVSNSILNTDLNADQVDGIDEINIYNNVQDASIDKPASTYTGDLNDIRATGFYNGNTMTNAPDTSWWYIIHIEHINNSGYSKQIAYGLFDDRVLNRRREGGTWSGWSGSWVS